MRRFLGLILAIECVSAVSSSLPSSDALEPDGVLPSSKKPPCVLVMNLHVRKCGGTSVRNLFQSMAPEWTECEDHSNLSEVDGLAWAELHQDEDIVDFTEKVTSVRASLEPRGCQVVSTLLLRDPVDQVVSEWAYFFQNHTTAEMEDRGLPTAWTSELWPYASTHPEQMLRWLVSGTPSSERASGLANTCAPLTSTPASAQHLTHLPLHRLVGLQRNPNATNVWNETDLSIDWDPVRGVLDMPDGALGADCGVVSNLLAVQFASIDLVGTMDAPREFAQWWRALGRMAGFDATQFKEQDEVKLANRDDDPSSLLSRDQIERLREMNPCGKIAQDLARARFKDVEAGLLKVKRTQL